jgi:putative selenium metabolism hydrolase
MGEKFKELAAQYKDEIVKTASEMLQLPSNSLQEAEMAAYTEKKLKELGYDEVVVDRYGSVFGVMHGTGGGSSVLMNCHMDVVDAGDPSKWQYPPYSGAIAEGRIWGRGASDTKGTFAIQVYIPPMLKAAGLLPKGDMIVAGVVAEENAGFGSMMHTREDRYITDYCILGEASENDIAVGSRGRFCVVITVTGKACHASVPHAGVNPFDAVSEILDLLKTMPLNTDPMFGQSTMTVTKMESSEKGTNLVPNEAVIYADFRQSALEDSEENVLARVKELLKPVEKNGIQLDVRILYFPVTTYTGVEGDGFQGERVFVVDPATDYVQFAKKAVEEAVGHEIQAKPWPFATDAGHYQVKGVKCLGYSPAELPLCHTTRDSIDIAMMEEGIVGYLALVKALADQER